MSTHSIHFTTHEGIQRTVPVDTIRLIKPLTDNDKEKARANLSAKGIEIDPERISARIEFADKSSKLVREDIDALRGQGLALVNLGAERYTPAINITSAEPFTKDDASRLNDLKGTFRAKVHTRGAGVLLSSGHPVQVMDRRAKALGLADVRKAPANV